MVLPELGDILMGKHRLESILGEGGFGVVYRTITLSSNRPVAIKVLKPGNKGYDNVRAERFMRELRTIAQLTSPHTVTLFDFGRTPEGLLFMVCEMVEGEDLADLMDRRGRLSEAETVHILKQALHSLREAHDLGVLHRDIKPANLRVFEYDNNPLRVKVLDFGLAKSLQHDDSPLTAAGRVIGTPRYMSPEQLYGLELTPASDLYSLGLVAYEMLLGRNSRDAFKIGDKPFLSIGDPVSRDVRLAINRMLESEVGDRVQTAADLLATLAQLNLSKPKRPDGVAISARPSNSALAEIAPTLEDAPIEEPTDVVAARQAEPTTVEEIAAPPVEEAEPGTVSLRLLLAVMVALSWIAVIATVVFRESAPEPKRTDAIGVVRQAGLLKPPSAAPHVVPPAPTPAVDPPVVAAPPPPGFAPVGHGCKKRAPFIGAGQLARKADNTSYYQAYVPKTYDPLTEHPLVVLVIDKSRESGNLFESSGLDEQADKHGFVIVTALIRDTGRGGRNAVMKAMDAAAENLCIDEWRAFGVGLGPGAHVVNQLSCDVPFVSIVSASARPERDASCAHPVPHLILVDRGDLLLPPTGGALPSTYDPACIKKADAAAYPQFLARWGRGSCPPIAESSDDCFGWACGGAPLVICEVDGGRLWQAEHTWGPCAGEENRDFPYAQKIWSFFESTARKPVRKPRVRP